MQVLGSRILHAKELDLMQKWFYSCRRSGETREMRSRKRSAVLSDDLRKCCEKGARRGRACFFVELFMMWEATRP